MIDINQERIKLFCHKLLNFLTDREKEDNGSSLTIAALLKSSDFQVQHQLYNMSCI